MCLGCRRGGRIFYDITGRVSMGLLIEVKEGNRRTLEGQGSIYVPMRLLLLTRRLWVGRRRHSV
jgi:hypothetical protein